jgi:hypothetical protein
VSLGEILLLLANLKRKRVLFQSIRREVPVFVGRKRRLCVLFSVSFPATRGPPAPSLTGITGGQPARGQPARTAYEGAAQLGKPARGRTYRGTAHKEVVEMHTGLRPKSSLRPNLAAMKLQDRQTIAHLTPHPVYWTGPAGLLKMHHQDVYSPICLSKTSHAKDATSFPYIR